MEEKHKQNKKIIREGYVYKVKNKNNVNQWFLVIYCISNQHFLGYYIYSDKPAQSFYIKSFDKYIDLLNLEELKISNIINPVYSRSTLLKTRKKELKTIIEKTINEKFEFLNTNCNDNQDITYSKWCKDKYILNNFTQEKNFEIRQFNVFWVNLGYRVGSELRKIRPCIIWKYKKGTNTATIIPLTSNNSKKYFFHYKIKRLNSTAKIEAMENVSILRIFEPFYDKGTIQYINKREVTQIKKIIKSYYIYE